MTETPRHHSDNFMIQLHVTEADGRVWHLYQIAERHERKTVIAKLLDGSGDPDVIRTLDTHGTVEIAQVHGPMPMSKRRLRGYWRRFNALDAVYRGSCLEFLGVR
jgi:hypothetical protein